MDGCISAPRKSCVGRSSLMIPSWGRFTGTFLGNPPRSRCPSMTSFQELHKALMKPAVISRAAH
jgi:hypothetical protein